MRDIEGGAGSRGRFEGLPLSTGAVVFSGFVILNMKAPHSRSLSKANNKSLEVSDARSEVYAFVV